MRLIKAKVSGYKRLAENCELNLDANPVCIVGPNAAGKSSFLDALVHLNHRNPFKHTEKTRVPGGRTLEPQIEARFALSEEDRALLADIPEANTVRQLIVTKYGDRDGIWYNAEPYPSRDLTKRQEVQVKLGQLAESNWLEGAKAVEEGLELPPNPLIGTLFEAAMELVTSREERMEEEAGDLDAFSERLGSILGQIGESVESLEGGDVYLGPSWPAFPEDLVTLPADLLALAEIEREEHPLRKVRRALSEHVPKFLKFDDRARRLETKYDLTGDEPEEEAGIHNFLALAGTSWAEALEVVNVDDPGWKKTYIEDRDKLLKERATLMWGQSDIGVTMGLDGSILTILLSMQAHDFIGLDDHSDGLKQFMALRSFAWQEATGDAKVKPIVLIDEADMHLHYDAQADIVGVFEEQQEAAKIIYTTHSAGCLPRDLGLGVRAIVPETEEVEGKVVQKDHSQTVNRFWTEGRGFSPLLLAMGAGAFAFSATQYALITEGMSDALLLPTLLREATGEARLQYQPVPSFAEATADEIARFDLIGGRVAFLADGDEGGQAHAERLVKNGISEEQILFLGGSPDSGLSIEDLLTKTTYLHALNAELQTWHGVKFPADQLPDKGRSRVVEDWCAEQTGRDGKPIKLSKVDVAQQALDQRFKRNLLASGRRAHLRRIDQQILEIFEGAPKRMQELRHRAAEAEG